MKLVLAFLLFASATAKVTEVVCTGCTDEKICGTYNDANALGLKLADGLGASTSCDMYTAGEATCKAAGGTQTCKEDCFPASARVELESGEFKRMDEIKVGDRVRVGANEFSDVFFFTHVEKESRMEYLAIKTASGKTLTISAGHMMGANAGLVAARTVQVGDNVTLADGSTDKVVKITKSLEQGLYAPQTLTGEIVVDGVLASCFTDYSAPEIQQMLLAPLKMLYQMNGAWWLGANSDSGVPAWLHNFALGWKK